MTVNYTTNLALGQPVTGTESGTWGDDVNNSVTSYLDIAIAGGLAITITTTDVTLSLTQGTSSATNIGSTTAQYAILNISGAMTAARNLILPSSSRQYVINNNTTGGFALTVKGAATTGVTMVNGESSHIYWNGSDYAKLSNAPGGTGTFTNLTYTGTLTGSTGVIAIGTNQIYKDSSGNVGIGTSSPGAKLQVGDGASAVQSWVSGSNSGTGGGAFTAVRNGSSYVAAFGNYSALLGGAYSASPVMYFVGGLQFSEAGAERMRIDSTGNVGIGTSSPAFPLDVGGTFANIRVAPSTATNNALTRYVNTGGTGYVGLDSSAGGLTAAYALNLYHTGAYPIVFSTSGAERMRIDSTGNVGIGTSSPVAKLDVQSANASIFVTSTTGTNSVAFRANNTGGYMIVGRDSSTGGNYGAAYASVVWSNGAYPMLFATNDIERMRIDSSGNLLVGTTSFAYNPTQGATITGGSIGAVGIGHASGTATGNGYVNFAYNGSNIGSITQSGTTAVLYNVTSDQRLKENIVDAPEFGSVIDSIKVRSYDWKADGNHQRAGFIAQELVTVAPEAVHQPVNEEEMMAVDYSKLVPMLVKEIQSLRKRLAALEAR